MQSQYLHHIHKRKRVHQQLAPYPHPNPWFRFLDKLLLVLAVLGPSTGLPQVYDIFVHKTAAGVSGLSWMLYALLSIPWLVYGFVHRDKPIFISTLLWLFIDVAVAIGSVLYG